MLVYACHEGRIILYGYWIALYYVMVGSRKIEQIIPAAPTTATLNPCDLVAGAVKACPLVEADEDMLLCSICWCSERPMEDEISGVSTADRFNRLYTLLNICGSFEWIGVVVVLVVVSISR